MQFLGQQWFVCCRGVLLCGHKKCGFVESCLHSVFVNVVSPCCCLSVYACPDALLFFLCHSVPLGNLNVSSATPLAYLVIQGRTDCYARTVCHVLSSLILTSMFCNLKYLVKRMELFDFFKTRIFHLPLFPHSGMDSFYL